MPHAKGPIAEIRELIAKLDVINHKTSFDAITGDARRTGLLKALDIIKEPFEELLKACEMVVPAFEDSLTWCPERDKYMMMKKKLDEFKAAIARGKGESE